jgi:hypothetical protein
MIVSKKSKTDDVYKIKLYHHGDVGDKMIVSKKSKTDDVNKIKLYHHGDVRDKRHHVNNSEYPDTFLL